MDFVTRTLGSFSLSSSPFTKNDQISAAGENYSIWSVYNGLVRKDSAPCTLFEYSGSGNNSRLPLAQNALKMLRKLRVPGIIKLTDSVESPNTLLIATEPVVPLASILSTLSTAAKLWGLQTVLATLGNLHEHVKCVHANININNVWVTHGGEWVLAGLEIATFLEQQGESMWPYASMLPQASEKHIPPEVRRNGWPGHGNGSLIDSYMFGVLVQEVLGPTEMSHSIQKIVSSLLAAQRPSIAKVVKRKLEFDNVVSSIVDAVPSIMIMSDYDFVQLVQKIQQAHKELPAMYVGGRLIPELVKTASTGKGGVETTRAVIKLSCLAPEEQFQQNALPFIINLFGVPDRATRMCLLEALPDYIANVPAKVVQTKIMPAMAIGFTDTEPQIRRQTLDVVSHITPKLSSNQLNDTLLRHLAKTNNDVEPDIRAKTIQLIGSLAEVMAPYTRSAVVVPALAKALRDPVQLVQTTALEAIITTSTYFAPMECAEKLLGPTASAVLDSDAGVRAMANRILTLLLEKINDASKALDESLEGGAVEPRKTLADTGFWFDRSEKQTSQANSGPVHTNDHKSEPSKASGVILEAADYRSDSALDPLEDDDGQGWDDWALDDEAAEPAEKPRDAEDENAEWAW